jgi:hypothetical protein
MRNPKSKRETKSHSSARNIKNLNSSTRKTAKSKRGARRTAGRRSQSSLQPKERSESKQARIIAMLRAPSGATIEAMVHTTGWQQHSVRGFLAGIIRKKLGLNLTSAAAEGGRIYRIADRTALSVAAAKTSQAA